MEPVVTVGLDGSAESLAAARWAAGEAHRRHAVLRLLHAWILLSPEAAGVPAEKDQNYWAQRIVDDAEAEVRKHHPRLAIVKDLVAEPADTALLRAAKESGILVLGSRGLEAIESFFLGDTSLHLVARADGPVVLVRAGLREAGPQAGAAEARVAVGLSLHGPCDSLLEFAFDTAAGRGAPLYAVHGRNLPVAAHAPWAVDAAEEVATAARRELGGALRPWREKYPGVPVDTAVRLESPARAVVHAAEGSGLLVLGRRRHRPALGPRVGPVAHAAVHHAACPVAVIPHD